MKFAAIADIHGNCAALEAVLADIKTLGIEEVVNLGDHLSGPLEAKRTADLLIERGFPTICGNHDRQLIELPVDEMGASDLAAYKQLEQKHLIWLANLPETLHYKDDVFLCHGTPASDTSYWLEHVTTEGIVSATPIEQVEKEAAGLSTSLILCGHTHIPRIVRLRDGRLIVNPGSVGCPAYDSEIPVPHVMQVGTPAACYAILEKHPHGWDTTFRFVPYDHMAMADIAHRNGRSDWASALATGWM